MRGMVSMGTVLALMAVPSFAQAPRQFPVGATYKVISISGYDVQNKNLSLTVTRIGDGMRGAGNAGCNDWTAGVLLRDNEIDFTSIATTKKACDKARMTAEDAFTNSLRSAQRWHLDDKNRLIIEGDTARLLLTASSGAKR